MKPRKFLWIALAGALLAPMSSYAQISCSREGLQRAVDLYIAAQTKGDTSGLPLATGLGYMENVAPAATALEIMRRVTPGRFTSFHALNGAPSAVASDWPAPFAPLAWTGNQWIAPVADPENPAS